MTRILNTLTKENFQETVEKAKVVVNWRGAVQIQITDGDVNHAERITRNALCKKATELKFDEVKLVLLKERFSKLDKEASDLLDKKNGLVRLLHSIWAFFGNIGYKRAELFTPIKTAANQAAEEIEARNAAREQATKEQNELERIHELVQFDDTLAEDKEFVRLYKMLDGPSNLDVTEKNKEAFQAMIKLADEKKYSFACYYLAKYYKAHKDIDGKTFHDKNTLLYEKYLFLAADAGHPTALALAVEINDKYDEKALLTGNQKILRRVEDKKFPRKSTQEIEAIKQKNPKSAEDYISLGVASITSVNPSSEELQEAFKNYTLAMNAGSPDGKYLVAKCHYEGRGTPKDENKAFGMFKELKTNGHVLTLGWLIAEKMFL